jgi:hypothetical protein
MTADQLKLTPRLVSRIVTFVITLAVGVALSQLVPLRLWEGQGAKSEVRGERQIKRRCPNQR